MISDSSMNRSYYSNSQYSQPEGMSTKQHETSFQKEPRIRSKTFVSEESKQGLNNSSSFLRQDSFTSDYQETNSRTHLQNSIRNVQQMHTKIHVSSIKGIVKRELKGSKRPYSKNGEFDHANFDEGLSKIDEDSVSINDEQSSLAKSGIKRGHTSQRFGPQNYNRSASDAWSSIKE